MFSGDLFKFFKLSENKDGSQIYLNLFKKKKHNKI